MHNAMFIVHALEQSPVYWNFCTLIKSWCIVHFLSPLLFQMKVIALLQQVVGPECFIVHFDLAFFSSVGSMQNLAKLR